MTKTSRQERNHFARILKRSEVNKLITMLNEVSDDTFEQVKAGQLLFECRAPDNDVVFSGALLDSNCYAVLMHREVFDEAVPN